MEPLRPLQAAISASNLPSDAPFANEESTNCWASSRGNFHNLVFKLLSFPEGMFRARNRGTATAQPKASALQPQLVWRGGSGSPLTATSAPLVLFLALHRRLRFPRRLQALWEANDTPVYGGCQYFNAIYCISILTREMRLSRAAFSTTYV